MVDRSDVETIDSTSTTTSYSFLSDESRAARKEVAIQGNLEVMNASSEKPTRKEISDCFDTYVCTLTKDGRLTVTKDTVSHKFIIDKCTALDEDSVFRLDVGSEFDLNFATDVLICKATNEMVFTKWLLAIDNVLRKRLQLHHESTDCVHGKLSINIYDAKRTYNLDKDLRKCSAYYYHDSFRVKGLYAHTVTYKILCIELKESKFPMCFILTTELGKLLCRCHTPDMFKCWVLAIQKGIAPVVEKDQNCTKEGELIVYSSDIERTRVRAVFDKRTRRLDISDKGGISDSFLVHRCHVPFNCEDQNYNFELSIAMANEKIMILYCKAIDEDSAVEWVNMFSPDPMKLANLLGWTVQEIEFRRIYSGEHTSKTTTQAKDLTFLELLDILDNTKDQEMFKTTVANAKVWNVTRLERLVQLIFRIMPGPVIPYDQQCAFIELSREMSLSSHKINTGIQMLLERVPDYTEKILKLLSNHVTELIPYLNRKKSSYGKSELKVWRRLAKYVFRTNEQDLHENEEDILMNDAAIILDSIQQHYLRISGQSSSSSAALRANTVGAASFGSDTASRLSVLTTDTQALRKSSCRQQ